MVQQNAAGGSNRPVSRREALRTSLGLSAAILMNSRPVSAASPGMVVPPESGPHTRTWMAWPHLASVWGEQLSGMQEDIARIARTIAAYEPVFLCATAAEAAKAKSQCGSSVTVLSDIPVDDCWMRDTGPIFRVDGKGGLDIVGLNFNGWGKKQVHANDAQVAARIAAYLGIPFTAAGLTCEGGGIETDGAGTLMATTSSIVNPNRNPGMTKARIEAEMCKAYGASKVIWFPGVVDKDITDDHVDATSRWIDSGGHAAVQFPPASDTSIWANDGRQQYQLMSAASNAQGKPVSITKLAGPDIRKIRQAADPDFIASYANFYVCNGAVIAGQFGDEAADEAARETLAGFFPGRTVVQLNIDALGGGGGGIHCVTQQQPR